MSVTAQLPAVAACPAPADKGGTAQALALPPTAQGLALPPTAQVALGGPGTAATPSHDSEPGQARHKGGGRWHERVSEAAVYRYLHSCGARRLHIGTCIASLFRTLTVAAAVYRPPACDGIVSAAGWGEGLKRAGGTGEAWGGARAGEEIEARAGARVGWQGLVARVGRKG